MSQLVNYPLKTAVRQSPPVDYSPPANDKWIEDKTIVITGGASGLGASFLKRWATAGATVIIGDIDVKKGDQLVHDVKRETGNLRLHFFHCDVTQWQSQVQFFRDAVKVSPHGGIDTVVANAGILDAANSFEEPHDIDMAEPPPPDLRILDVNMTGVVLTTHLALHYLPNNPKSSPASIEGNSSLRDRHLLLVSSMAGVVPLPGNPLYSTAKHAVVGLFRSLRSSGFVRGVRVNMLCPYFIDTPLIPAAGRALLAGGVLGKAEDVVEAGTRFVADPCILGRAAAVGPKMKVKQDLDGEWRLVETNDGPGEHKAIWEAYADDFEDNEIFSRNYVRLLNRVVEIRGWVGWFTDVFAAVRYGLGWS